jgi:hypothetical protein
MGDDGEIKEFDLWKVHISKMLPRAKEVVSLFDYINMSTFLDGMTQVEIDMDVFVKEVIILMDARYNFYDSKMQKLLDTL